jgi:hypothetical protein
VAFAQSVGELRRDEEARRIWREIYEPLSEGKPGMLGSVASRAEAQVVRLSLLYALLDCSKLIRREHLLVGLAAWDYCEASARYIFGDALGYPEADRILGALRTIPEGLSRTEVMDLFGRNRSAAEVDAALARLAELGLVHSATEPTEGRYLIRWRAVRSTK